ncbi:putative Myo-inositol transporter 1 [Aureobasidium subglaciale]|nr:putative Myo-inositol transporter 1 [Aureobasidium subglaciale]KAI5221844.1 putative Myo-inositol transporter 1 [Aureobasidium subglaciale]KAI5225790.1 putative Myo-inositol transporter 1 [Aureobasidium subglaciale]KAI5261579.1 putative Myo-inositol transporter 1 [Aureobasidium subglaciale]
MPHINMFGRDDQGVFSGIVGNADWLETFGHPGSGLEGIIVSIYNLGAFSGCILAFLGGEKAGRRLSMWIAMVFIIIGAILQTTSYGVPQILVARYITGIGTGIETSTVPMYQSELVEAHKRGRVVSSEPLFVGVGIVIAYFFDYGIAYVGGPIAWRLPIACQIIFAIVVIIMVFGVPESPRYLYKEGRNEEALQVLCDVYDGTPTDEKIAREQKDILDALAMERMHGEYKWSQILKRDEVQTGRRVLLAYGMQFMNQIGGINLVVYFVPTALERNVGLSHNLSLLIGGFVQTMFFFGSLIPTFLLDRMGRRRPMMWGSLGLAISMMLIAVLLSFTEARGYSEKLNKATSSASVAFFFTYMFIFGASANCIPWVYVPEILPLHARAKGTAIGISSNWLWVMITPTLINNLQWQAYLIFMCTNLAFVPLVYFWQVSVHLIRPTSNLTLEEVDYLFVGEGSKGIHKFISPCQPVKISLSGDVERGAKEMMHDEKRGSEGDAAYVEDVGKPISHSGVTSTGGAVPASGRL